MWFQTLKTRQSVRSFSTKNSQGLVAGIEYTDKKAEVHTLKRETTPLSLEEGAVVAFLSHENGGMSLLAVSQCGKGKSCIELRVWDAMSSIGFTAKEIVAQDLQGNIVNEGKFKAIVSLPETLPGAHPSLKVDSLKDFVSLAVSTGLIVVWRFRKVENGTISLELFSVMKSSMTIQDIAFFQSENTSKKGPPSLVVGEPGVVKVYTAAQNNDASSEPDGEAKFVSTLIPFPSSDIGSTVQDIQRSSPSCCILSDSSGRLWYLNPPLLEEIMLPSSKGGHGVFAVQPKHGQAEGWLATIDQGQTVNLFKLSSVIESTDSGLVVQPWHAILSPHPLSTLSFMEPNVLAGASNANKSISLWVGINNIGTSRLESA